VPLLPRSYDRDAIRDYWIQRPISIAKRLGHIVYELAPIAGAYTRDTWFVDEHENKDVMLTKRAADLREALTNLGPAFVKGRWLLRTFLFI
jgi:predicted unusual protein kinase regulating ubiquinone biosynthesis (AarF/ABC1/UbiB family)